MKPNQKPSFKRVREDGKEMLVPVPVNRAARRVMAASLRKAQKKARG